MRIARNIFQEIATLGHDEDFEPPLDDNPTSYAPGSWEKIQVMCDRVDRGRAVFHPHDLGNCKCEPEQEQFKKGEYVTEQRKRRFKERIRPSPFRRKEPNYQNCVICGTRFVAKRITKPRKTCGPDCFRDLLRLNQLENWAG